MLTMRQTVWIFDDQLTLQNTALAAADRQSAVIFMMERRTSAPHLRWHKIKLVMIFSAMRHFARELQADGWRVDYHSLGETESVETALDLHLSRFASSELVVMEPNSMPERALLESAGARWKSGSHVFPTCQFVVARADFLKAAAGKKRLLMETHYRATRRELGILVDDSGEPEGGMWNFDASNRRTVADWKRDGSQRPLPRSPYHCDALTREVMADVDRWFPDAFGSSDLFSVPVTREEALRVLSEFVEQRLVRFGDYQDLMLENEPGMFHSWISAPLNLGLLGPLECVEAAVVAYRSGRAPLAAVEGFVRQVIGWREFINGVYWLKMPAYAAVNALDATRPLPEFFYSGRTEMNCLRKVLGEAHDSAYNHHIQRLMILGNFLLLAGVRPQEALAWFTEMYIDAYDWVMAANVLGMALHADGGFMATKPYAGAAAYISKMSNYCGACAFDPKKKSGVGACPFNLLYWNFYDRHADRFASNPRTSMMVSAWRKRPASEQKAIRDDAAKFLQGLAGK